MKTHILKWIRDWCLKYQPNLTHEEWYVLYDNLIAEEKEETQEALNNDDIVEFIDGVVDTLWVQVIYIYFKLQLIKWTDTFQEITLIIEESCKLIGDKTNLNPKYVLDFLEEATEEVMNSNYTKSLELQTEWAKVWKVIKWENFVKPDLQKIIDKYNVALI